MHSQPPAIILNKERRRILLLIGLFLCDFAAIRAGFALATLVRPWYWFAIASIELGWVLMPIHLLLATRAGAVSWEALQSPSTSVRRAVSALIVATSVVSLLLFLLRIGDHISRIGFGVAILATLACIILLRLAFHALFVASVKGGLIAELLIVDGVPIRPGAYHVFDAAAASFVPDLGNPEMLSRMAILLEPYDRVIVATVVERQHAWAHLLKAYNVLGEILLDQGTPLGAIGISRYHGSDTAIVARGPMSLANRAQKRVMDLAVATGGVVALAPLLLLIALAIKLDSRGPVFFVQTRFGRNNRPFRIIKFRSIRHGSTDADGKQSVTRDDDRITRVGRILRMTSLDELPQLFNVLKGEMSIVGPRPHALGSMAGEKLFWEVTERYWLRHMLKPGITGLAQVRGYRGTTHLQSDLENRLQSDLEYIEGWRLWRDITIIINTLGVVVHHRAY